MKKCPGCGSISSDQDERCGVCGASLLDVRPTDESLEQVEVEFNAKEKAYDQRWDSAEKKGFRRETLIGLSAGTFLVLFGGWLLISSLETLNGWAVLIGLLVLFLGLSSVEAGLGVFRGAPYHGIGWWAWIAPFPREPKERDKEEEERE